MNHANTHRGLPGLATPGRADVSTVDEATGDRLDALYETLRGTWAAEIEARRAYRTLDAWLDENRDSEDYDREHAKLRGLMDATDDAGRPRRTAYFELLHAVLEAAGREGITWEDWYSYGRPLATVRVRNRVFAVVVDSDADYADFEESGEGLWELTVIDLDEIGGVS